MEEGTYTVSELARASGVTVRTLHHYDRLGVLTPSARTGSGYRLYSAADASRLADVLAYRACGVPLAQIPALLDADAGDRAAALRRQLAALDERAGALRRQREALAAALQLHERGIAMGTGERFEAFGDFDPAEYEREAEERWGDTDAYRESKRRTSAYTAADWERITAESRGIEDELASCLDAGLPAESERARAAAEAHRRHIDTWFYPCSYELQTGLADMYVADERFARHYEDVRPGLAEYVRAAIWANAVAQAS